MIDRLHNYLAIARGDSPAELVLKDVRIVNVYSGEIFLTDLAIHHGKIIGWGRYTGERELDIQGSYLLPGLIDAHLHLESSMVLPDEFCRVVLPHGTTTVAVDPHEVANVAGIRGIEFIRQYCGRLPLNILIQLPSCVPATPNELSGATLLAEDLEPLLDLPGIHGLGEMMNFFGVVEGNLEVLQKLEIMRGRFKDGHAPLLVDEALNAYCFAGIGADHECTSIEEAREKIRRGMYVMIREGSAAKDLTKILPLIKAENARRFVFCTDDRHPTDILEEGHMDYVVRKAIAGGIAPIEAVRMATLNAAECLGLNELGAIAPGKRADMVVVNDLRNFQVTHVFKDGRLAAQDGKLVRDIGYSPEIQLRNTVQVGEVKLADLQIPLAERYRIMCIQSDQLLTSQIIGRVAMEEGGTKILEPDVAKIIVVERYRGRSQMGIGLIKGFGLERGAMGSSVAHDSHNIVIVGKDDLSILAVLQRIILEQGGLAIALDGHLREILPLPLGGLISDQPIAWVTEKLNHLHQLAYAQGVKLSDPYMTLSFMALPVIPELKITSQGLFNVNQNKFVNLAVEDSYQERY